MLIHTDESQSHATQDSQISSPLDGGSNQSETTAATPATLGSPKAKPRRDDKNYSCDYPGCDKAYSRPARLAEHQRSHTNERPFVCENEGCDKTFLRSSHLKHHVKSAHDDVRDYPCDWPGCDRAFSTGQRMRYHRKRHDEKEQFRCKGHPPCDQIFRKQETLDRHVLAVHLNDKPYTCDHVDEETGQMCGRKFGQSHQLVSHREHQHGADRYWCNLCETDDVMMADPNGPPPVRILAPVGFRTHGELQRHVKEQHPPLCEECGQVCATSGQLKAHIDIHHGTGAGEKNFACEYDGCGRTFTKKGNLNVHVRGVHEKQKRFVCGEFDLSQSKHTPGWDGHGACGRPFVTKGSLENHVRTQHLHLPDKSEARKLKRQQRQADRIDESTAPSTIGPLTGTGYQEARHIACVVMPCVQRFSRAYDLEMHLELVHGFPGLAAMEAAVEQEAVSGGRFWIGGSGDEDEDEEDALLAQRLNRALNANFPQDAYHLSVEQ